MPEIGRPPLRNQELSALARKSLYERIPLTFTLVDGDPISFTRNWESDWPSILYAPVARAATRPVGLLMVGARTRHWYSTEEVGYVASLATSLASFVERVTGPLGRLTEEERSLSELIGQGLSNSEIAVALATDEDDVKQRIQTILGKLRLRSRRQIARLLPDRPARSGAYLL